MSTSLSRHVRSVLEGLPDALPPTELLHLVDEFVFSCSSSTESEVWIAQLEDNLQVVHHEVVDHSSFYQTETFLAVLYHLRTLLSASSIISVWFDLVLRPALREPKLPIATIKQAQELIVSTLRNPDQCQPDKVPEFRRRLLDFFLLDAFNDSSGDDVLEWAKLNTAEREKRIRWKENLENILLAFGMERPHDLMNEIDHCFKTPSCRLQLLTFLNTYVSHKSFLSSAAKVLASHPLMLSLLNSLLLDNSSTICTIGLKLFLNLCPIFAVEACEQLKIMLPKLLVILARILCWKERPSYSDSTEIDSNIAEAEGEVEQDFVSNADLQLRADLEWERLDVVFPTTESSPPPLRRYFTILYYLFPCNVLLFLRTPIAHLTLHRTESPYTLDWEGILDEDEIRSKSERLLRCHSCHPSIIWRDAPGELSLQDIWTRYDVSRIVSESMMLDVENGAWNLSNKPNEPESTQGSYSTTTPAPISQEQEQSSGPVTGPIVLSSGRSHISLRHMSTASMALKSDTEVDNRKSWPSALFPSIPVSLAIERGSRTLTSSSSSPSVDEMPPHVVKAIAHLQREVLLLRNELNFELWLSRENVKHIGRLYQDHILSRNAEAERQGLYNKLRKYRSQVASLDKELREHKEQASSAKTKYSDWNSELGQRLRELREEKKAWIREAASLRTAEKETQSRFVAQGKLLDAATKRVFELETERKEFQHKVDRLHDYERQIQQHIKMQRLWDDDFKKFNDRADQMNAMQSRFKQMELRLESYEKTQAGLEEAGRVYRRRIQSLEARLNLANKQNEATRQTRAFEIAAFASEKGSLMDINQKLRDKNAELVEELEEVREMVEVLKGQVGRKRGLVSDPSCSPTLG